MISIVVAPLLPSSDTANTLLRLTEKSGIGFSGLIKRYGAPASLVGLTLPDDEESFRVRRMKGRALICDFVERHCILALMVVESWDSASGDIIFDLDNYEATSGTLIQDVDLPIRYLKRKKRSWTFSRF